MSVNERGNRRRRKKPDERGAAPPSRPETTESDVAEEQCATSEPASAFTPAEAEDCDEPPVPSAVPEARASEEERVPALPPAPSGMVDGEVDARPGSESVAEGGGVPDVEASRATPTDDEPAAGPVRAPAVGDAVVPGRNPTRRRRAATNAEGGGGKRRRSTEPPSKPEGATAMAPEDESPHAGPTIPSPPPVDLAVDGWTGLAVEGGCGEHAGGATAVTVAATEDSGEPGDDAGGLEPLLRAVSDQDGAPGALPVADVGRTHLKGLIEALVFVSDRPVSIVELARAAGKADRKLVRGLLDELRREYAPRGIHLDEVAGGWLFRTSATYAPFVRDAAARKPVRMSRAQIETLAIVAYRQPLTRPEIDEIRGVDSGPVLKMLLERDLVRILGKKDEAGRPLLYGTTPAFLEFFGLKSLRDLPSLREFTELSDDSRKIYEQKMDEPFDASVLPTATQAPVGGTADGGGLDLAASGGPPDDAPAKMPGRDAAPSEQPSSEQPSSEQPSSEQPSSEQPSSEQPSSEQPSSEQPSSEQPSSAHQAIEGAEGAAGGDEKRTNESEPSSPGDTAAAPASHSTGGIDEQDDAPDPDAGDRQQAGSAQVDSDVDLLTEADLAGFTQALVADDFDRSTDVLPDTDSFGPVEDSQFASDWDDVLVCSSAAEARADADDCSAAVERLPRDALTDPMVEHPFDSADSPEPDSRRPGDLARDGGEPDPKVETDDIPEPNE